MGSGKTDGGTPKRSGGGPPQASKGGLSSTSTLLKEISSLRTRLKDLEDDNKSTISSVVDESQLLNMLRKDLARVEEEKAQQEREFMNQLASLSMENQCKLDALQEKLNLAEEEKENALAELRTSFAARLDAAEQSNLNLTTKLSALKDNDNSERFLTLLEQERQDCEIKLEQMKSNLAQADIEIADSRREMDILQEQLLQSQSEKETLMGEVSGLRVEMKLENERTKELLDEEREAYAAEIKELKDRLASTTEIEGEEKFEVGLLREKINVLQNRNDGLNSDVRSLQKELSNEQIHTESLQTQLKDKETELSTFRAQVEEKEALLHQKDEDIGEMNDALISLEEQKSLLVNLNAEARVQTQHVEEEKRALRDELASLKSSGVLSSSTEDSVEQLEGRIKSLNEKLKAKDSKIDRLNESLNEERDAIRELKKQAKSMTNSPKIQTANSDVLLLRSQNKALNEEVKALRLRCSKAPSIPQLSIPDSVKPKNSPPGPGMLKPVNSNSPTRSPINSRSPSVHSKLHPNLVPPPPLTSDSNENSTPGKISGIVASFERRLASTGSASDNETTSDSQPQQLQMNSSGLYNTFEAEAVLAAEMQQRIEEATRGLQNELEIEKETVQQLRVKLDTEMAEVDKLRASMSGNVELEQKLESSNVEIKRLKKQLEEYENKSTELGDKMRLSQQESKSLRMQLNDAESGRSKVDDLKVKISKLEKERLEVERKLAANLVEHETQKRDLYAQVDQLRADLQEVRKYKFQEEKKEGDNEEEVARLRDQVSSLEEEVQDSLRQIEAYQKEVMDIKKRAHGSTQVVSKREAEQLESKLSKLQVEKAGLELEFSNRIAELENELEVMEVAAEEELLEKEKQLEKLEAKAKSQQQQIKRLEDEKSQLCTSMNDVSLTRKDEYNSLQDELMDVTNKNVVYKREIETLKRKLSDKSGESERVLKARSRELEEALRLGKCHEADVEGLRKENSKLRDTIREVKMDRRALHDKLNSIVSDKGSSKSSQVLRERNAALKQEVERLTKRMKKLEESITRFAI